MHPNDWYYQQNNLILITKVHIYLKVIVKQEKFIHLYSYNWCTCKDILLLFMVSSRYQNLNLITLDEHFMLSKGLSDWQILKTDEMSPMI